MYYSKLNRFFPLKYPISSTSKNVYIFIFNGFLKKMLDRLMETFVQHFEILAITI